VKTPVGAAAPDPAPGSRVVHVSVPGARTMLPMWGSGLTHSGNSRGVMSRSRRSISSIQKRVGMIPGAECQHL
jgi:hypothetical protein